MFAEHNAVGLHADRFGRHDLVGDAVLQHSVLVYACFVRERVLPTTALLGCTITPVMFESVWLERKALPSSRRIHKASGLCARSAYYLFERGVAGALADAVDGAFDLARSGGDGGQRVATASPRSCGSAR